MGQNQGQQKNFGDQIKDAIDDAINSNDFSALKDTVGQALNRAAYEVSRGMAQAQEEARRNQERADLDRQKREQRQAQERQKREQNQAIRRQQQELRQRERAEMQQRQLELRKAEMQRRQELAAVQYRFKNVAGMKVGGGGMVAGGILLALGFSGGAFSSLLGTALVGTSGFGIATAVMGALAVASIGLIAAGVRRLRFTDLFRKYQDIIGTRMFCNVEELAVCTGKDIPYTLKMLKKMLARGMFTEGRLDRDEKILMVTNESYQQYQAAIDAQKERERKQKLVESVTPHDDSNGLTAEQQSLLDMGKAYVVKIRASNEAIPDEVVSRKIDQIELVVNKIFEYARENPAVIPELERLMDYYLPTTVKLLDAYAALDAQPIQGENISASKREIEETLDTLAVAFEKLLDSIFRDMTWDVSTDISVLHTVLAQEGLVEGAFDHKKDDGAK